MNTWFAIVRLVERFSAEIASLQQKASLCLILLFTFRKWLTKKILKKFLDHLMTTGTSLTNAIFFDDLIDLILQKLLLNDKISK